MAMADKKNEPHQLVIKKTKVIIAQTIIFLIY
jgi:hypothetical protein